MGEKAQLSRLSFEAVVGAAVIFVSLGIHMVAFSSNSWFWFKELTGDETDKVETLHTMSVWKTVVCTTSKKVTICREDFNVFAWARATAAFVTIALVLHLTCLVCSFLYIVWRRNKRFVFAAAVGMLVTGAIKCLSALIWGFSATLYNREGWLDWSFALLLVTMSLDWTSGLVCIVEHAEAKQVRPDERRRPRISSGIEEQPEPVLDSV